MDTKSLKDLLERVLTLPEEVSRPCLVPLSKVGFSPGRLVHTNEFHIVDDDGKERILSHTQAAAYLKQKYGDIIEAAPAKEVDILSNTEHLEPRKEESLQTSETKSGTVACAVAGVDDSSDEEDEEVVEITEHVDADDNVIRHEKIRVSDQLKAMEAAVERLSEEKASCGEEDEGRERVLGMLRAMRLSGAETRGTDRKTDGAFDNEDDGSFVREIERRSRRARRTPGWRAEDVDLSFFEEIEKRNACLPLHVESGADVSPHRQDSAYVASKKIPGWQRGFLSSVPAEKKPVQIKSILKQSRSAAGGSGDSVAAAKVATEAPVVVVSDTRPDVSAVAGSVVEKKLELKPIRASGAARAAAFKRKESTA